MTHSGVRNISHQVQSAAATSLPGVLGDLASIALRALNVAIAVIAFDTPAVAGTGLAVMPGNVWAEANRDTDFVRLVDPRRVAELGLRFYAGAPLRDSAGARIGTFAVLDTEERTLSDDDLAVIGLFARVAEFLVDAKRAN